MDDADLQKKINKKPMNPKVDEFLNKTKKWQKELTLLRSIILECGLEEDFKWMHPCYTVKGSNIVLIHGFKDYCALLFMKGALLKDTENILIQQTENVQSGRQIRFTNAQQIMELKPILKAYIFEAIERILPLVHLHQEWFRTVGRRRISVRAVVSQCAAPKAGIDAERALKGAGLHGELGHGGEDGRADIRQFAADHGALFPARSGSEHSGLDRQVVGASVAGERVSAVQLIRAAHFAGKAGSRTISACPCASWPTSCGATSGGASC